jgi:hypothetical protein
VRGIKIKNWPFGNKPMRVDVGMTLVVMQLDVFEVAGFLDSWLLVEVFEIIPKIRIFVDVAEVALEVNVIDGVEAE